MADGGSVLVNFVYCHPVGHMIEALHYCHGYHRADSGLRIGLAVNADTPAELAALCPYIGDVYPVTLDLLDPVPDLAALDRIPSGWDWAVDDDRGHQQPQRDVFPGLGAYYDQADERFAAARSVLGALSRRWPQAVFCLLGKLRQDGRTATSFGRAELDELTASVPESVDAVDLPIIDGLAAAAACDVLVSPHTGFGMAALAVGTPWLSIAGNLWPEYYFNGVPFYSVLPDVRRFPAYTGLGPEPEPVDDDGPRSPSMCRERIEADLDEITEGAARLIERRWPAEQALADHVTRMLALRDGRADRIWSVDSVHRKYLNQN